VEDEDAGLQVRWRGLRLRELSGAPESD